MGDFVLSGGEIPTLLMIDAIVRMFPGVIGDIESAKTDSFQGGLLDNPHYTRPENIKICVICKKQYCEHHVNDYGGHVECWICDDSGDDDD